MSLNFRSDGNTIELTDLSTGVASSALYAKGSAVGEAWWGVVQAQVIGTTETQTTVDGRPILDEDVTPTGDGDGSLRVTGVFQIPVASGIANAGTFQTGDVVYASGFGGVAGIDDSGQNGASDVTSYGMIQSKAAFDVYGASGGLSVVGHVWAPPYLESNSASPFAGMWVAEVKLLGHPQVGLV